VCVSGEILIVGWLNVLTLTVNESGLLEKKLLNSVSRGLVLENYQDAERLVKGY
jgi:hypothetical protein